MHIREVWLLSILITTYNVEKYIEECLDSVKKCCEWINYEICIVDDVSKDDTVNIINQWISKNKNIKVIFEQNKKNCWPWWANQHAYLLSKWEFITFLDGDDFLIRNLKDKIDILKKDSNKKLVYGNAYIYKNNILTKEEKQPNIKDLYGNSVEETLKQISINVPQLIITWTVIRWSFMDEIGWFDENCLSNDYLLNIKIFKNINEINEVSFDRNPVFWYRVHWWNISYNRERMRKLIKQVIDNYVPVKYKDTAYCNLHYSFANQYAMTYNIKKAFYHLKEGIDFKFSMKRIIVFIILLIFPYSLMKAIWNILPKSIKKNSIKIFH